MSILRSQTSVLLAFFAGKRLYCPRTGFLSGLIVARGAGLGLSIVERVIHACHGRIKVESCPGEWSPFTVIPPISHQNLTFQN